MDRDRDPLSEVLNTIRVKETMTSMDDRPRFKRVFGTDIDPEYSRDNEWKELMSRAKIKQRLKAARDRRKSKLQDMEKKLASDVAEVSIQQEPVKNSPNKAKLLAEYNSMKGKSVNLRPSPEHRENRIGSKNDNEPVLKEPEKENRNDEKGVYNEVRPFSTEEQSRSTIVVSAIIENKMIDMDENELDTNYCVPKKEADYASEVNEENDSNKEMGDVHDQSSDGSEELEEKTEDAVGNLEEETKEKTEPMPKQRKKKVKQKKKVKSKPTTKEKHVNVKLPKHKDKKDDLKGIKEDAEEHNNNEQTTGDENNTKASNKWKKSAMKVLPWTDMCSKLRQRIEEENEKQMDFLETIRILRGISRSEFYKDIENDSTDSETEQLPKEEPEPVQTPPLPAPRTPTPPIDESENKSEVVENSKEEEVTKEDTFTTEVNPELPVVVIEKKEELEQKTPKKGVVSRIDTRWPAGHKFHTKPAEQKYLSFYLKPIHHKLSKNKINIHTLPRTAKEITEYLQWREKLLEIAYLNEFSHLRKFSLLSFAMPLPSIEQNSFSPYPVQNKKRSLSRSTNRSSVHNEQNTTFQQQSYLAFNKRNGTDHKSTPRPQHKNKEKKKTRNKDNENPNPYLTSNTFRKKKHDKCKKEKISHKVEQDIDYGSPVENELETLMSKMNEDSKRSRNDTGAKSQSTDSAINEPSYDSDENESDVTGTPTRNSSIGKDQEKEDTGDFIPKERQLTGEGRRTNHSEKASV
ncbi:myb-like protein X [Saccostrea cucullata]|uniref:myb-like protein X n=1 Tax=Saccostrea cuccullata TaxID=36930 RepID=UPI002ED2D518